MKKIILIIGILFFSSNLFAQNVKQIIEAVNVFPNGVLWEATNVETPKFVKTDIRFVRFENKERQREGWYEFEIESENSDEIYRKVDKEDLETMLQVVKWMKEIVVSGDYSGEFISAQTKNGWIIWLPEGEWEDIHVSQVFETRIQTKIFNTPIFETPYPTTVFYTSVLADNFRNNPNMGIEDFLQSLIDSFDERLQKPIRRSAK